MFKNLFRLETQRTTREAFGFYLAYLGLCLVVLFILGPIIEPDGMSEARLLELVDLMKETKQAPEELKAYIDHISFYSAVFSVIVMAGLSVFIAWKKNIFKEPKILAVIIGATVIGYFTGPIFGLIPVAWLTTQAEN
jgi:hypothetical protein